MDIRLILSSLLCSAATLYAHADIIINELMQSNVYCIMDDMKEFPDSWLELYNDGEKGLSLKGYKVGLTANPANAYTLPAVNIGPGSYQLVYCDKADTKMHTDFRIDSGKGDIYLFDPEGKQIDHLSLKKQPAPDVAYGRETDGSSKWGYQLTPTPGKANEGGITSVVLGDVVFSQPGGVWAQRHNMQLYLELPDNAPEGSYIIYTEDGKEPTLENSKVYGSNYIIINRGKVIRAKAVCEGCISRPSTAHSYIFLDREMKIPVIAIAVNDEYLYDKSIGIFAGGSNGNENYRQDWRRPINLEYFEYEGAEAAINQLCETRVQGGWTRGNSLKSLALYANKRFGTKRFNYEFWAKDKPGVTDNKSFILRNGGNDFGWCYFRDGLIQRVIGRNTNIDWQGYAPVIVCINGKYHGMLALRERSNEDNIVANYGGLEDIDMFELWWEIKSGGWDERNKLEEFIKYTHTFDEWTEVINIESFVNMMAINYWVYNTDFPHNNIVMWRRNDGKDGRWQWLIKDTDFGLGIWNSEENLYKSHHSFLMSHYEEPGSGYVMYRQLMKCPEFVDYYVNHLVAYMGDFLNADTFCSYLDEIYAENEGEQKISHQKWGEWWSNYDNNIKFMRDWINKRGKYMHTLMLRDFNLGSAVNVKINNELTDDEIDELHLKYNDVKLTKSVFSGKDFKGRTIRLEGDKKDRIVGWKVKIGTAEAEIVDDKALTLNIAEAKDITINAIIGDSGISDIMADNTFEQYGSIITASGKIQAYDLSGRLVASGNGSLTLPAKGVYMIKTADGMTSKVVW